jgi:hypothetical protein
MLVLDEQLQRIRQLHPTGAAPLKACAEIPTLAVEVPRVKQPERSKTRRLYDRYCVNCDHLLVLADQRYICENCP